MNFRLTFEEVSPERGVQGGLSDNIYDSLLLTFQLYIQDFLSTV